MRRRRADYVSQCGTPPVIFESRKKRDSQSRSHRDNKQDGRQVTPQIEAMERNLTIINNARWFAQIEQAQGSVARRKQTSA
jgi:hypothetical protein